MANKALGRDLGTLLGRNPKESVALPAVTRDPAPLGAGVRSLMQKRAPPPPSPGIPRWYLFAGDALLVALALVTVYKSSGPLSLGREIFCVATVMLAAALGVVAVLAPPAQTGQSSSAGAGVTANGESPKQFGNHKAGAPNAQQ